MTDHPYHALIISTHLPGLILYRSVTATVLKNFSIHKYHHRSFESLQMYIYTVIFAVLSAGAFPDNTHTIFLTAFAPADTDCTGAPVGNNVTVTTPFSLDPSNHKGKPVMGACMLYAPGPGQNIQFEYSNDSFVLKAYSEPNCQNMTAMFTGKSNENSYCMPMSTPASIIYENYGADWQSIQLSPMYTGKPPHHTWTELSAFNGTDCCGTIGESWLIITWISLIQIMVKQLKSWV